MLPHAESAGPRGRRNGGTRGPASKIGPGANRHGSGVARRREPVSSPRRRTEIHDVHEERALSSARSSAFIPAVDDGWAVLSLPPGERDLGLPDYWALSAQRSRRRREARRSAAAEHGGLKVGAALAVPAFGGTATGAATGPDDAAAQSATASSTSPAARGAPPSWRCSASSGSRPTASSGHRRTGPSSASSARTGSPAIGRVGPLTTAALGLRVSPSDSTSSVKQLGPA